MIANDGVEYCCAYCRHWMYGTIDPQSRVDARISNKVCTCHVHQTGVTKLGIGQHRASDFCLHYEEILMHGHRAPTQDVKEW